MEQLDPRDGASLAGLAKGGPQGLADAISAFEARSAAGEPDADCWMALLAAGGVGMPQSWERALDCLERAATRGSAFALGQLTALAVGPAGNDPRALRASIDPSAMLRTPAKRQINAQPRIRAIDGFLSAEIAAWLISRARGRLARAQVFQGSAGTMYGGRTNTACMFNFADCDVVILLVRQKIANALGVPSGALEVPQVLHYETGEQFAQHCDWLDPADAGQAEEIAKAGQRIATCLIYLNEDYAEGETAFPRLGLKHRGRLGDVLYFANVRVDGTPDQNSLHAGLAPSRGEKWVFSQWVRNLARV